MAKKKSGEHISLAREEYDAFKSIVEDQFPTLTLEHANLAVLSTAQSAQLREMSLKVMHLERICGLQGELVEALRDEGNQLDIRLLFRAWDAYQLDVHKAKEQNRAPLGWMLVKSPESARMVPISYDTREAHDAAQPKSQAELQEHQIVRLRQANAALEAKAKAYEDELENRKAEIAKLKALPVPSSVPQPGRVSP